ncbi:hypothetical protein [Aliarcobacter cryaerophilus]|uniref:Uncharacterized protein n=1 Tax=Arcobacter sp. AZ-2023 TaxID=3074453 RepID=A0AA96I334_9BACT|nr:hypothetical protein RJG54_06225 [Arcobacter sp. AZ-2023]
MSYLSYNAKDVQIDASAETLLLEDDEDLKFLERVLRNMKTQTF